MNTKSKFLVFLLLAVMLAIQFVPVSAQGNTPPPPDQLTQAQMKNAVVVGDGSTVSRSNKEGATYRFAVCDESNPEAPCYFTVTGNGTFYDNTSKSSITPLASNATISCGVNIYNYVGNLAARFKQNINVTFGGTYGQTPVTLNWGDLGGTATYVPYYYWQNVTGPNPNPGWGVYVSRSGTAYSNASGLLNYAPPSPIPGVQNYVTTRITIRSSGWSCS